MRKCDMTGIGGCSAGEPSLKILDRCGKSADPFGCGQRSAGETNSLMAAASEAAAIRGAIRER